jgi:DNA replication and repair protein RecF
MSQQGAKITRYRAEVTEKLKKKAGGQRKIECLKGEVSLEYHPVAEGNESEVRDLIRQRLFNNRELDKERGRTVFGPHLDELKIYLDGKPARAFASEGEKKGIAAFLTILAWEVIAEETGETPLLLIDDFPSVLDEQSAASLVGFLKGKGQVILTVTSQQPERLGLKDLEGENRLFLVKEGEVRVWNTLEPK